MTLGDVIKKYRETYDMSMDAFAARSGISKAYISILEKNRHPKTGKPVAPSVQCIKQVADAIGVDFDELFSSLDCNVSLDEKPFDFSLTLSELEERIILEFRNSEPAERDVLLRLLRLSEYSNALKGNKEDK